MFRPKTLFKKIITLLNTSYKIRYEYDSDSVVHKDGKKNAPVWTLRLSYIGSDNKKKED
jgi:hypothetical protein